MKTEQISFTKTLKDENGNVLRNDDGSPQTIAGEVNYQVPEDLDEGKRVWGEEVLLSNAIANVVVKVQNICRNAETVDKAQELANAYMPTVSRTKVGGASTEALINRVSKLSPEKKAELLKALGLA